MRNFFSLSPISIVNALEIHMFKLILEYFIYTDIVIKS
jgi:hypothetical protein